MRPQVSIVMPNYNFGRFLHATVSSVVAQTIRDWELIVIDNFSTDNSLEILESFSDSRIRVIRFRNHGSIASARNKGVQSATGKYVAFLDADDLWNKKKLQVQLRFHKQPNTVSYHDLKLFGSRKYGVFRGWTLTNPLEEMLVGGNPLATSSVLCDRDNFLQSGFPEGLDLATAEDFALWLEWASRGLNFVYIPRTLGSYRIHAGSNSKGNSTRAARQASKPYSKILSSEKLMSLEGWLAYSEAMESESVERKRDLLRFAARNSVLRYKWRSIARLVLLQFSRFSSASSH